MVNKKSIKNSDALVNTMNEIAQKELSQPQVSNLRPFTIYADMSKVDKTWERFGHETAPMAVFNDQNEIVSYPNYNLLMIEKNFHKILGGKFSYYPHERVDEIKDDLMDNELKDLKLSVQKEYVAHNGDTKYWRIVSDETFDVDGEGDKIKLGFVLRNGIGTIALGIDLFSFRQVCENGATRRGRDFGALSIKHVGKIDKISKIFEDGIRNAMTSAKELLEMYRKATQIKMNSKLVNKMYEQIWFLGEDYLPDWWQRTKSSKEIYEIYKARNLGNMEQEPIIKPTREETLWETFNAITQNQRDRLNGNKTRYPAIAYQQDRLHQAMEQVITVAA